ncbi:MAG TPA: hypothetical protein VHY84_25155 [Bryobacteraceae bacterium]|jgi:hypothetical protein|nr:hypothetical protein [Bryobacteraceae bacterium]
MTVTLKPEQERVVGEAIEAGLIGAADDVVDVGLETIRLRLESRARQSHQQAIDAAADRLLRFGKKYRFSLDGLTTRDLIDEGRR